MPWKEAQGGQFFGTICTPAKFTITGAWDHMHNTPISYPLLVLDMYEHDYHMDYGAAAAKYVDAFMQKCVLG